MSEYCHDCGLSHNQLAEIEEKQELRSQKEAAMPDKQTVERIAAKHCTYYSGSGGPFKVAYFDDVVAAINEALAQQKAEHERQLDAVRESALADETKLCDRLESVLNKAEAAESRLAEVMGVLREHEWDGDEVYDCGQARYYPTCKTCEPCERMENKRRREIVSILHRLSGPCSSSGYTTDDVVDTASEFANSELVNRLEAVCKALCNKCAIGAELCKCGTPKDLHHANGKICDAWAVRRQMD